jgi:hypothetical protein
MEAPIDRGIMGGRDVLIHIAMLPVTLAIAGTLIGVVWTAVHAWSQSRQWPSQANPAAP